VNWRRAVMIVMGVSHFRVVMFHPSRSQNATADSSLIRALLRSTTASRRVLVAGDSRPQGRGDDETGCGSVHEKPLMDCGNGRPVERRAERNGGN
jgi:hypothetical protein